MLAYLNEKLPVTTDQDLRVALVQLMKGQMQIEMLITAREEYVLSVIDPAYPPGRPSWPRPLFLLVGGAFVGALLGLLVAALAGLWGRVMIGGASCRARVVQYGVDLGGRSIIKK